MIWTPCSQNTSEGDPDSWRRRTNRDSTQACRKLTMFLCVRVRHQTLNTITWNVGLSSGRVLRRRGGETSSHQWPSHSCTLVMSASFESAFVAAVARNECTQSPFTSALMPVSRPYFHDDVAIDRTGRERMVEIARAVIRHWRKTGSAISAAAASERQVVPRSPLRHRMHRNEPDLAALAPDPKNAPHPDGFGCPGLATAHSSSRLLPVIEQGSRMARLRTPLSVRWPAPSSSLRAGASPNAGVLPWLPFAIGDAGRRLSPAS